MHSSKQQHFPTGSNQAIEGRIPKDLEEYGQHSSSVLSFSNLGSCTSLKVGKSSKVASTNF